MQTEEDRRREREARRAHRAAAVAELTKALNTLPANHSTWSYQTTVSYKEAVIKGQKLVKQEDPKIETVLEVTRRILTFHR